LIKKIKIFFFISFVPIILGTISSFSLPPYSFIILNFITFPLLFYIYLLNYKNGKWISFLIGWSFGFGYFISSLYWVANSLTFDENLKSYIPFAIFLIPLFLGLFYGVVTIVCYFLKLKKDLISILIFSLVFSLVEYARSLLFGGFPWNLIVFSLSEYSNLLQILSYIGTYSLNLITITIFFLPYIFFVNQNINSKIYTSLVSIILITGIYLFGIFQIENFNKRKEVLLNAKLKIIAPKIEIEEYYNYNNLPLILDYLFRLSDGKQNEETIFIFPEGVLTGIDLNNLKEYKSKFQNNFSDKHKLILGINSSIKNNIYNSLVIIDNNINIIDIYNKNKLVPFGEFLPLENIFSKIGFKKVTQGYQSFSSGDKRKVLEINNLRILPLICYEIIYSGKLNNEKQQFDFILNISEDGWFKQSIGIEQHFFHSKFRAIEEGKNIIRVANNGITAQIDPVGQVINKIESTDKGVMEVQGFKKTNNTLFSIHGNKLFFYFILIYISLIFFLKFIRR
tara:strand:+ start:4310 stop:5836 length:1527 start_codon:yes stop_codon:yes gene_type:complete